jgi:hypothetical protein
LLATPITFTNRPLTPSPNLVNNLQWTVDCPLQLPPFYGIFRKPNPQSWYLEKTPPDLIDLPWPYLLIIDNGEAVAFKQLTSMGLVIWKRTTTHDVAIRSYIWWSKKVILLSEQPARHGNQKVFYDTPCRSVRWSNSLNATKRHDQPQQTDPPNGRKLQSALLIIAWPQMARGFNGSRKSALWLDPGCIAYLDYFGRCWGSSTRNLCRDNTPNINYFGREIDIFADRLIPRSQWLTF